MRAAYPSDISREQFEIIRHTLETAKKATRPREIDIYDIFCAILYRKREGCRWRSPAVCLRQTGRSPLSRSESARPHDFPKWEICYYHYNEWRQITMDGESVLDRVLRELAESERRIHGRSGQTSMLTVDSRSVKNAYTAEQKGYDAGKKHHVAARRPPPKGRICEANVLKV